jgi:hypothetical protein
MNPSAIGENGEMFPQQIVLAGGYLFVLRKVTLPG